MKTLVHIFSLVLILSACTGDKEPETILLGEWDATWKTDPASFQGIDGITHFTMDGKLVFEEKRVNIQAYGFEGCAFGADTLDHSLFWKVSNDSLQLINSEETPGMDYLIKNLTEDKVELQLLDDIFLTLEKKS